MPTYSIRVGRSGTTKGARMYLDPDAFDAGELRLVEGTLGEQCEGCGADLSARGVVEGLPAPTGVRCDVCDLRYPVEVE